MTGWDLIVPAGWGMAFWLALQFAGARAIGNFQLKLFAVIPFLCFETRVYSSNPTQKVMHKYAHFVSLSFLFASLFMEGPSTSQVCGMRVVYLLNTGVHISRMIALTLGLEIWRQQQRPRWPWLCMLADHPANVFRFRHLLVPFLVLCEGCLTSSFLIVFSPYSE
jgi:hypothetical protein